VSAEVRSGALPREPAWPVHAALLAAQTGFALFPIFGKFALATLPPLVLAAIRVCAAALLLDLWRRAAGAERIAPRDRPALFLYALLGVSINQVFFILGLNWSTAINTSILTATIPIFTLAAAVVLGRERLTGSGLAALLLAGAGALVLLQANRFDWHSRHLLGNLMLLANSLSYSFYLVLSRPLLARYRPLTVVAGLFLYGAPAIVLAAAPALTRFEPSRVTPASWWALAGVIVFPSVLSYLFNSWALARTPASTVAFYVFLQPLIASALAIAILGERLTPRTLVAGALILAGLAVSVVRVRRVDPGNAPLMS
jgi:drug/metabolite transporter (DMT)-like permease